MAATRTASAHRRRARRGSLERPLNARLYRASFGAAILPLVVLAFSIVRPAPLPAPILPANFDGNATRALAADLADHYPDRSPGTAGSLQAAGWFRDQMRQYDLPVFSDVWEEDVPGLGRVRLENIWAVAPGQSREAIVVMAHRDDTGAGPGANDDASGTAALVELARGYAQTTGPGAVRSGHTLVFLSTDAGAFGGLGALRFAQRPPFRVVATINLDAIAGGGRARVEVAGDAPRSPAATLVATAARRIEEQTGRPPARESIGEQLVDLGFPFTLYEQGPFVARGIPAVTLTSAGARPPEAFTDRSTALSTATLGALGRAAQQLVGSLDQGLELAQGTTTYVWAGSRFVRGWAIELLLFSLLVPYLVAVVDLFARLRRRRIPLLPAVRSLRSRVAFWLFAALAFYVFRWLGAWPTGAARPPDPSTPVAGDWPVLGLFLLGSVLFLAWLVPRQRLVPRRDIADEERLAGEAAALIGLAIVALLVLATNPYALVFFVPALHAWLWLPQARPRSRAWAFALLALGLVGPALILVSLATRFGLGLDAPWYLLELVSLRYVHVPAVAITLAGAACAAQLAAVAAHRYAPYPGRHERPPRGPLRELVRTIVLTFRARRR
ncbi:MAG TPA: M28 family peptidase [Gaiellaceae bacterium]|nr:M28 family peptidase [Gaiellaceae bacterium]